MTTHAKVKIVTFLLVLVVSTMAAPVRASANSFFISDPSFAQPSNPGFDEYPNEQVRVLRELSFGDHLAFPIVQQPRGNMIFVSPLQNYITEYQAAATFGSIGLLAHNYLAGQYFFQVVHGQEITLTYSDLGSEKFIVTEIKQYQALTPESPSSDFIDLATGERLTASQVFRRTYGDQEGRLILQTCISANENPSWGRIFIIAERADEFPG